MNTINKQPLEIAAHLSALFCRKFGGDNNTTYQISRDDFKLLAGRLQLESVIVQRTKAALQKNHGLLLLDTGDSLLVMHKDHALSARRVNTSTVKAQSLRDPSKQWPFPDEREH